jgi:hypothetical protein
MGNATKGTRENRTITIDFHNEAQIPPDLVVKT